MGKKRNAGIGMGEARSLYGGIVSTALSQGYHRNGKDPGTGVKQRARRVRFYAAKHGLDLKVGPLYYAIENPLPLINKIEQLAVGHDKMAGKMLWAWLYQIAKVGRNKIKSPLPIWISILQKQSIETAFKRRFE
jgi:hypothetical protein